LDCFFSASGVLEVVVIEKVKSLLEGAIEQHVFPGCTVGIMVNGKKLKRAFGRFTYDADAEMVTDDTVYDVASITKAVPVSCLALKLIENGEIAIDDRLIDLLPDYTGNYRQYITFRHLLTHTLDFGFRLSSFRHLTGDRLMEKILSAPLESAPGSVYSYANGTSILLGMAIERRMGMALDEAAQRTFFTPLGMQQTTFHPEKIDMNKVAPSEYDPWRKRMVRAEVHDESAFALHPTIVGSAGLFSTAADLLKFASMLVNDGSAYNRRFFKTETVALMHTNCCPVGGTLTGLGWELAQPAFMGKRCSAATFGKTGFTGCSMVVDPERKAAVVLLSNHVHPERQSDRLIINKVRGGLADIVFEAVTAG
jgi:CubicO group peptidase (beta-lactamase class C family)